MKEIKNIGFKGYKAFQKDEYACINDISKVNVIIGKNNSGKTSLLDAVELVYSEKAPIRSGVEIESVYFDIPLNEEVVKGMFGQFSAIGGWIPKTFTEHINGMHFPIEIRGKSSLVFSRPEMLGELKSYADRTTHVLNERRKTYSFRKIHAERNVNPEMEYDRELDWNGNGATNLVRKFLNDCKYDESVIEQELLEALNYIMLPEAEYETIRVQQIEKEGNIYWEVFLQEKGMQRVPLSKVGSGLKTIVLVLLNLIVIPKTDEYKNLNLVYGFEELENNLHPALQRRLFEYIYDFAVKEDVIIYLTTHSHIAINTFFDKEDARLFHVVKKEGNATIKSIETHVDKTEILDDLDVKASDLLQSNGIIWVEGPSDRIYIKRWLEVLTPNKFEEGRDYQFLYYGGRLLSQYSAKEETDLISIITTNRNAAIVIDSDKRYASMPINTTKKRIIKEFDELNMFSWVTKGKEIENYLPKEAVEVCLKVELGKQCDLYELFPDYIESKYKNFSNKKVPFANQIKDYITSENSAGFLDLKKQIDQLYKQMEKWNK